MTDHWAEAAATEWHQKVLPATLRDIEETVPVWKGLGGSSKARRVSPALRAAWKKPLTARAAWEDGPRSHPGGCAVWGKGLGRGNVVSSCKGLMSLSHFCRRFQQGHALGLLCHPAGTVDPVPQLTAETCSLGTGRNRSQESVWRQGGRQPPVLLFQVELEVHCQSSQ